MIGRRGAFRVRQSGIRCQAVTVSVCRRGAEGDIAASSRLHDSPDRVNNDLRLVDRHDVTGFFRDDHNPRSDSEA